MYVHSSIKTNTSGTPEVCLLPAAMPDKDKLVLYNRLYVSTKITKK